MASFTSSQIDSAQSQTHYEKLEQFNTDNEHEGSSDSKHDAECLYPHGVLSTLLTNEPWAWLQDISSQFFQMVPVRRIKWKDEDAALLVSSPKLQIQLLNATVKHPLCSNFPPALSYRRYFMKMLIQRLESEDSDIADEVYESYTDLLSCPEDDEDTLCYKSYHLPSGEFVSLQESVHLVSQGTTGLSTWQAAQHLAEWILENPEVVADKSVAELGCGLGFTGIAVCMCCTVRRYYFTDCHSQVLHLLSKNIELNLRNNKETNEADNTSSSPSLKEKQMMKTIHRQISLSSTDRDKCDTTHTDAETITRLSDFDQIQTCEVEHILKESADFFPNVQYWLINASGESASLKSSPHINLCSLNWENVDCDTLNKLRSDIILAADVVYDLSIIPSLVYVLKGLLSPRSGDEEKPKAYIASTIRNEDTRDAFLIAMASEGLSHRVMDSPQQHMFYYDRSVPIEILEFSMS